LPCVEDSLVIVYRQSTDESLMGECLAPSSTEKGKSRLRDILRGKAKTGSTTAIVGYIASRGIVSRAELRRRFKGGSVRTTIYYLKRLGLVYSREGMDGFVISIPWLLYVKKILRERWRDAVRSRVPGISEEELTELEKKLREAEKGPWGEFVKGLVRASKLETIVEESLEDLLAVIPDKCSYPRPSDWRIVGESISEDSAGELVNRDECLKALEFLGFEAVDSYYVECMRPLLGYIEWLLTLVVVVAEHLSVRGQDGLEELAAILVEQADTLKEESGTLLWEVKLHIRTMYKLARMLREINKNSTVFSEIIKKIVNNYDKEFRHLRDQEKYNMRSIFRAFQRMTLTTLLLNPPYRD